MKMRYLYGKLASILLVLLAASSFISCTDEEVISGVENKDQVSLTLKFTADISSSVISSRAPSDNALNDLYIFIFDANGSLRTKRYYSSSELTDNSNGSQPNTAGEDNWVKVTTTIGDSYIYGIANVEESGSQYKSDIKSLLDEVNSKSDLMNISAELNEDISRVGNTYLMAGTVNEGKVYTITANADVKLLKLQRVDSAITFKFAKGGNCTDFVLESYQVLNVPKRTYIVEHEAIKEVAKECNWDGASINNDFFSSSVITGTLNADQGFTFYMVENRKNGKKEITGRTDKERYGLREKQDKSSTGSDIRPTVENGAYTYAPDHGTYVVVKGRFSGTSTVEGEGNSGPVEASVRYTIHLGYVDKNANDFFSSRNTKYTYNVTVTGVNDIIVEVISEKETENSPGAEGDVIFTEGTTKYYLDAHYETVLLKFNKKLLEQGSKRTDFFTYKVATPFTKRGASSDNDWIKIIRNQKQNGKYSKSFQPYSNTNYMTMDDLIDELKTASENLSSELYDNDGNIVYTCHVDEFYYDKAPTGTTGINGSLWKYFVNTDNREVQILNDVRLSPDGQSSITRSTYILSQRAIQTFYNVDPKQTELSSAYGVESVDETGPLRTWDLYKKQIGKYPTDKDNGRSNFLSIISSYIGASWTTYLDWSINGYTDVEQTVRVNAMKENYKRAYLACLQRNRDLNGNGKIDDAEIKWYLPAMNQYAGMFLGDAGLSEEAKLYTETKYVYKHFITSTAKSKTNLIVYWGEESVSTSCDTEYSMVTTDVNNNTINYYRCMRNLGEGTPQNYYSYNSSAKVITVPFLNKGALRTSLPSGELGRHVNWDDGSKLSAAGYKYGNESSTRVSSNIGNAMQYYTYWPANSKCYDITAGRVSKGYWRAPNVRELYLMSVVGNILKSNDVSRTIFKFHDQEKPSTAGGGTYRIGWFYNGSNVTMGSGTTTEGDHIRCVRDN